MKKLLLAFVFLTLSACVSTAHAPVQTGEYVTISILQGFSEDELSDEIEQLEDAIGRPGVRQIDLLLNTPGGYVYVMDRIRVLINAAKDKNIIVRTNIVNYAASCGADIFMEGDVRIMGVNDDILFHEMSITIEGVTLTVSELGEIVRTGTLTRAVDRATITFINSKAGREYLQDNMSELRDALPELEADMRRMDMLLAHQLGKSYAWVKANVCVPFKDTWFTGQQALELGIATQLDRS
jgi:ATP-dependent protease ClpP protease subunit